MGIFFLCSTLVLIMEADGYRRSAFSRMCRGNYESIWAADAGWAIARSPPWLDPPPSPLQSLLSPKKCCHSSEDGLTFCKKTDLILGSQCWGYIVPMKGNFNGRVTVASPQRLHWICPQIFLLRECLLLIGRQEKLTGERYPLAMTAHHISSPNFILRTATC